MCAGAFYRLPINATAIPFNLVHRSCAVSLYFIAQPIYLDDIFGKNLSLVYQLNQLPS